MRFLRDFMGAIKAIIQGYILGALFVIPLLLLPFVVALAGLWKVIKSIAHLVGKNKEDQSGGGDLRVENEANKVNQQEKDG